MKTFLPVCLSIALACFASGVSAEEVSVTPYRPTVTNSAALSAPGWLELETGVIAQNNKDGSKQQALLYLTKLAFTPDFGVLIGGDAYASQTDGSANRVSGVGDTLLLLKHHFVLVEDVALGCEYGFKAPTAATGLGSGKIDLVLNGIYSRNIRGHSLDINLNVSKLGDAMASESAYQYGWSGTVFHPIDDKLGVMFELSGTMRNGFIPENQWLVASSYALSNKVVLDAGLSAGINAVSHRVALFGGMSMLLGKVR
jgi:hypothetical protein